jgi:hypothetical protein
MSRQRLLLVAASLLVALGAAGGAAAENVVGYARAVLIPGIARLQALDLASNAPCARERYVACALALRAEAVAAGKLRARLARPPASLAKPVGALRTGLNTLVTSLETAAAVSSRRRTIGTSALTRRFDLAFQALNGAIQRIDQLMPPQSRVPTFLP